MCQENTLNTLFERSLTFRWDLLLLFNRAHIDAKGGEPVCLESELSNDEDKDEDSVIKNNAHLISELIHLFMSLRNSAMA